MKGTEKQMAFLRKLLEERGLSLEWAKEVSEIAGWSAGDLINYLLQTKRNADKEKIAKWVQAKALMAVFENTEKRIGKEGYFYFIPMFPDFVEMDTLRKAGQILSLFTKENAKELKKSKEFTELVEEIKGGLS
ncbi:MAG: hypothetical protein QXG54_04845 [Desulfurococcaceae archaeon]